MKPPIIADSRGDVLVFDTVALAASYMEPVDVRNGEWVAFDSEGRLLTVEVEPKGRHERTVLKPGEGIPDHASILRNTLVRYLLRTRLAAPGMEQMSLRQLIDLMPLKRERQKRTDLREIFGTKTGCVTLLLMLLATLVGYTAYVHWEVPAEKRFYRSRFGTDEANLYFNSRVRLGMSSEEVTHNVPRADRVAFLLLQDGMIAQQFVYARPFAADYQVNAVYENNRVVDVEYDDRYLGPTTPLSQQAAKDRLAREGSAKTQSEHNRALSHSIYGKWVVVSFEQPGITALSPAEAKTWIGRAALFSDSVVTFDSDRCASPNYSLDTIVAGQFTARSRVYPSELGLGDTVVSTVVGCPGRWTAPGSQLYHRGSELITPWDGTYFVLRRRR